MKKKALGGVAQAQAASHMDCDGELEHLTLRRSKSNNCEEPEGPIWRAALARASALAASRAASALACSTDALMASISSSSMLCSAACFAAFTATCFSSANFLAKALAALQSHGCER